MGKNYSTLNNWLSKLTLYNSESIGHDSFCVIVAWLCAFETFARTVFYLPTIFFAFFWYCFLKQEHWCWCCMNALGVFWTSSLEWKSPTKPSATRLASLACKSSKLIDLNAVGVVAAGIFAFETFARTVFCLKTVVIFFPQERWYWPWSTSAVGVLNSDFATNTRFLKRQFGYNAWRTGSHNNGAMDFSSP